MNEKVLLISCYELGHQPLSLAWPIAWLKQADIPVSTIDLYTDSLDDSAIKEASFIGISVPMHTALRIGVEATKKIREINPSVHICFYGLYASLNADYLLANWSDSVLSGEFEEELVKHVKNVSLEKNFHQSDISKSILERLPFPIPSRESLPDLSKYAKFQQGNHSVLAGYTESTRGCLHTCAHCPVVPIYQGRFFVVAFETVMADIRQQVHAGAQHITFGDPDFLNAPKHAINITKALHQEWPDLTYSFTVKVEHVLLHKELFETFKETGCSFVVTAFESVDNRVLTRLGKGHTLQDMEEALNILDLENITPHTTWMPFTPWTTLDGYLALLEWIRENDLIQFVPAVQLSVRMLVPPKSNLLDHPDVADWVGELNAENFTYRWTHSDSRMDELQKQITKIAEVHMDQSPFEIFNLIEYAVREMGGYRLIERKMPTPMAKAIPQMTEHWFC